ncbi:hypothetical protein [Brevundimonas sp.]|uniref:hypothetical protein n=1 Tax=Brevundimonas sp. TaxID=1871086 RepID=UPI0035B1C9A5
MPFFCFVESSLVGLQYMQPLDADFIDDARGEAAGLLRHHERAYAAHIFADDEFVATIRAADIASS